MRATRPPSLAPLGIRLAVGQQTLDLHGEVRILYPQPFKKLSELLFERKLLIPALRQLVSLRLKQHDQRPRARGIDRDTLLT